MPSSTFKGKYQDCNTCIYQFYDFKKIKHNCSYSHKKIRENGIFVGSIPLERNFKSCGLYKLRYQTNRNIKI